MIPSRFYYTILQYCPDSIRDERVNVGYVLFRHVPREYNIVLMQKPSEGIKVVFERCRELRFFEETMAAVRSHFKSNYPRKVEDLSESIKHFSNQVTATPLRVLNYESRQMAEKFLDNNVLGTESIYDMEAIQHL